MKREIEDWLLGEIYPFIGISRPDNHDEIVEFIEQDVKETADPIDYHDGNFATAFRRFIESIITYK